MTHALEGYEQVHERILRFFEKHPDGALQPLFIEAPHYRIEADEDGQEWIVYGAKAYRNPKDLMPGIGLTREPYPGRTAFTRGSELENAETSAWGRALAAVGYPGAGGIATAEEVASAQANRPASKHTLATDEQLDEWAKAHTLDELISGLKEIGMEVPDGGDPSKAYRALTEFQFAQLRATTTKAATATDNGGDAA